MSLVFPRVELLQQQFLAVPNLEFFCLQGKSYINVKKLQIHSFNLELMNYYYRSSLSSVNTCVQTHCFMEHSETPLKFNRM